MASETTQAPTTLSTISAQAFARMSADELAGYTVLDLREPAEVVVYEIPGALNAPFSKFPRGLSDVPRDKPVIVICRVGNFSTQVAEILTDRGYRAINVEGGVDAVRKVLASAIPTAVAAAPVTVAAAAAAPAAPAASPADTAAPTFIDAKGLKCPGPIVKVSDTLQAAENGTQFVVEATEDAFASDIRIWCERTGNTLDELAVSDGLIRARITKGAGQQASIAAVGEEGVSAPGAPSTPSAPAPPATLPNDKTFIVFSGDLDKTIAAFIMANGAAAMGRHVTMFFTFWGLNILRRPEKVSVSKAFIGRMFGAMMPRGTKKLGLSRMNMGGAGAKMIRAVMKKNGISSLEELIDSARAHGVRLVACQMSMDIMGITKAELIDGVELGGVSTFLGAGEQSDMSLFI